MTIDENIDYWLDCAGNDLIVADGLFSLGHYDWCLFIGHLVLEKALKALYVQNSNNLTPPKIHNLLKLSEISNLELTYEQKKFFQIVNDFQIEARYPEFKKKLQNIASKEFTQLNLKKIKDNYLWIKTLIKSKS
jgi:HEPN domain-containing protein